MFGVSAFALFAVAATAISGAGKPSLAAAVAAVSLLTVIVANRVLILRAGLGDSTLEAAAIGTSIGMGVALVLSGIVLYREFGVFIPVLTWARAGLGLAAGYFSAHAMPHGSAFGAILALGVGFIAAFATLVVTRELGPSDWIAFRRIAKRD